MRGITNPRITLPQVPPAAGEHVWHLFVVRCAARDALQRHLSEHGIETLIHYPVPPHRQKAYQELNGTSLPLTERMHREVLSLPLSPVMEPQEVEAVIGVVNAFGGGGAL